MIEVAVDSDWGTPPSAIVVSRIEVSLRVKLLVAAGIDAVCKVCTVAWAELLTASGAFPMLDVGKAAGF